MTQYEVLARVVGRPLPRPVPSGPSAPEIIILDETVQDSLSRILDESLRAYRPHTTPARSEDLHKLVPVHQKFKCTVCQFGGGEDDPSEDGVKLPCGDVFHRDCITTYMKDYDERCPNCRTRLSG